MSARERTDSVTGHTQLRRLETFLDVTYAVLFVSFIMYLPETEDMAWVELPYGLVSLLLDHVTELIRLFVAVGLTLVSWNLTNKLLGPLERTDTVHTALVLLQLVFVCLFLFFAVADPMLESVSSPVGQSICLAISGFIGIAGWSYARRKGFARAELTEAEKDEFGGRVIIEPGTALLNAGFGFVSPGIWTIGWLVIPVVLIGARRRLKRARQAGRSE